MPASCLATGNAPPPLNTLRRTPPLVHARRRLVAERRGRSPLVRERGVSAIFSGDRLAACRSLRERYAARRRGVRCASALALSSQGRGDLSHSLAECAGEVGFVVAEGAGACRRAGYVRGAVGGS